MQGSMFLSYKVLGQSDRTNSAITPLKINIFQRFNDHEKRAANVVLTIFEMLENIMF